MKSSRNKNENSQNQKESSQNIIEITMKQNAEHVLQNNLLKLFLVLYRGDVSINNYIVALYCYKASSHSYKSVFMN